MLEPKSVRVVADDDSSENNEMNLCGRIAHSGHSGVLAN